jgi:hypothetical protein
VSRAGAANLAHPPSPDADANGRHAGHSYERHRPEETVLFKVLQAHWKTFLAELESGADPPVLPAFVICEVEAFFRCGILARGLVLAKSRDCGWSRAVAFSCQRRGFCPSCIGRRMCDFAARLTDRVIPLVPVRQWVLTLPHPLRARLAFDPSVTTLVLRELTAAVSKSQAPRQVEPAGRWEHDSRWYNETRGINSKIRL